MFENKRENYNKEVYSNKIEANHGLKPRRKMGGTMKRLFGSFRAFAGLLIFGSAIYGSESSPWGTVAVWDTTVPFP